MSLVWGSPTPATSRAVTQNQVFTNNFLSVPGQEFPEKLLHLFALQVPTLAQSPPPWQREAHS